MVQHNLNEVSVSRRRILGQRIRKSTVAIFAITILLLAGVTIWEIVERGLTPGFLVELAITTLCIINIVWMRALTRTVSTVQTNGRRQYERQREILEQIQILRSFSPQTRGTSVSESKTAKMFSQVNAESPRFAGAPEELRRALIEYGREDIAINVLFVLPEALERAVVSAAVVDTEWTVDSLPLDVPSAKPLWSISKYDLIIAWCPTDASYDARIPVAWIDADAELLVSPKRQGIATDLEALQVGSSVCWGIKTELSTGLVLLGIREIGVR